MSRPASDPNSGRTRVENYERASGARPPPAARTLRSFGMGDRLWCNEHRPRSDGMDDRRTTLGRDGQCSARGRGRDQSPLVRAAPSHPERRRPRAAPPTTVQRCEPTCRGREMNDARHSHGRGVPALPWHHHVAPRQGEWALRSLPPEKVRPATPSLSATYWTLYATRRGRWRIGKRSMRCTPR